MSTVRGAEPPLSSYPPGNLAGMTKRRNSSPYPHPPSAFVRELTKRGWRRCDAEALAIVAFCLQHADDDESLPTLARYAAAALAKEPVLAGAVMLFAPQAEWHAPRRACGTQRATTAARWRGFPS